MRLVHKDITALKKVLFGVGLLTPQIKSNGQFLLGMYVCMCVHICMYVCMCVYVCVCVCVCVCMYVCCIHSFSLELTKKTALFLSRSLSTDTHTHTLALSFSRIPSNTPTHSQHSPMGMGTPMVWSRRTSAMDNRSCYEENRHFPLD